MEIADEIRRRYKNGETQVALGAAYGVVHGTISYIVTNKTWKHP